MFKKTHSLPIFILVVLIIGIFMRGYQLKDRFLYGHDNDLSSWIIKDIVTDRHFRLIGQLTSAPGIFIGPLFYYSLIPFYLVGNMDPASGLYLSLLIGIISIISLYWVVGCLHSPVAGKISALLYAGSELISRTEREVVPTTPVMLWSIWCYYAANLVFKGDKKGFMIAAILFALVWHINLALILLAPIFVAGFFSSRNRFKFSDLALPAATFLILSAPLLFFEFRHGFIQTRALTQTLISAGEVTASIPLTEKISHVVFYAHKNANHIFLDNGNERGLWILPAVLVFGFVLLLLFKKLPAYLGLVFILWMGLFIFFFTYHPINLSEYYLNGMNIFWFIISGVLLAALFNTKIFRPLVLIILTGFLFGNLSSFLTSPINASGYYSRRAVVDFIAADARSHGYPCVSVSYITSPGNELGYRYLFYLQNLHVNQPKSGSPVYSIVFPHSLVDHLDKTFGALGLIYPDYTSYSPEAVKLSCAGANANLTDPMFGFTK